MNLTPLQTKVLYGVCQGYCAGYFHRWRHDGRDATAQVKRLEELGLVIIEHVQGKPSIEISPRGLKYLGRAA